MSVARTTTSRQAPTATDWQAAKERYKQSLRSRALAEVVALRRNRIHLVTPTHIAQFEYRALRKLLRRKPPTEWPYIIKELEHTADCHIEDTNIAITKFVAMICPHICSETVRTVYTVLGHLAVLYGPNPQCTFDRMRTKYGINAHAYKDALNCLEALGLVTITWGTPWIDGGRSTVVHLIYDYDTVLAHLRGFKYSQYSLTTRAIRWIYGSFNVLLSRVSHRGYWHSPHQVNQYKEIIRKIMWTRDDLMRERDYLRSRRVAKLAWWWARHAWSVEQERLHRRPITSLFDGDELELVS